jgi:NTP pyrophosphatase (non-canonical NTP hydrolase)
MTIEEAQTRIDEWIKTTGVRYFSELTNMAILTEEVGEVARLISRSYGDQSFKETDKNKELADELADVLWVVMCIANQTGVDLTEALKKNFEKKNIRDANRHQRKIYVMLTDTGIMRNYPGLMATCKNYVTFFLKISRNLKS